MTGGGPLDHIVTEACQGYYRTNKPEGGMNHRWLCVLAAAGVVAALSAAAFAPAAWAQSNRPAKLSQPQLRDDEQIMPSQIVKPPPPPAKPKVVAKPPVPKPEPASLTPEPDDNQLAVAKPAPPPKPAEPARTVACSGAFAKNSGHLRLAQAYGVHNVDFTEVSGDDGSTLMASVLFPSDPRRRLEVLWDDDAQRAGTRMIVIAGQSTWTAQKGVRLGLPLLALEKLNGKPFKLMGFDKGGMAIVSDWNGGAFGLLTDGCKVGVQFKPDPKAPEGALGAASGDNKEFASSDPAMRAAKPIIGEIIVAY
jgi:hypothetical protein